MDDVNHLVGMNLMVPLLVTSAENCYILVVVDYCTKWCEAVAIPNQEITTVATAVVYKCIVRFEAPSVTHCGQGSEFESHPVTKLCAFGNSKDEDYAIPPPRERGD